MLVLGLLATLAALLAVFYAWRTVSRARLALVTDIRLQRLQMAGSLAETISAIHRVAGSHPQEEADLSSLQSYLHAELAFFHAINGPPLQVTERLVASPLDQTENVRQIAQNGLKELADKAYNDDRLLVALDKHLNPVLRREGLKAAESKRSRMRRLIDFVMQLGAMTAPRPRHKAMAERNAPALTRQTVAILRGWPPEVRVVPSNPPSRQAA